MGAPHFGNQARLDPEGVQDFTMTGRIGQALMRVLTRQVHQL